MAEDIAKIILDTLKDFDYRLVTGNKLKKIWGEDIELMGMCRIANPGKTIYIRKGMGCEDTTVTQLHELAHAYLHTINKMSVPEKEVDRLAYEWKQKIDGVYYGKKQ